VKQDDDILAKKHRQDLAFMVLCRCRIQIELQWLSR